MVVTVHTQMGEAYFVTDDFAPRMTESEALGLIVPGAWISVHPDDLIDWLPEDGEWTKQDRPVN